MSEFKVFITGVTGYIGGDILYLINRFHPSWQVSCLVRDESKAKSLVSKYPSVRVVLGNLEDVRIIEDEAADSDVVYSCASSDHRISALAIARGLKRSRKERVYWIHTSGAGILTHQNFANNNFESSSMNEKVHDDWENVDELTSLPDKALHRHVDKIVLDASTNNKAKIKTAVISPPAIYGLARGPGNIRSVQVNVAIRIALRNGQALQMGDGNNIWHGVHIRDLSQLYLLLGEAAADGSSQASWNDKGYYLAEDEAFRWGDIIQDIANEASRRGFLSTNKIRGVNFAEGQKHDERFPYLCGTTSRGVGKRARMLLGWKPEQRHLREELPLLIKDEITFLGLKLPKKGSVCNVPIDYDAELIAIAEKL